MSRGPFFSKDPDCQGQAAILLAKRSGGVRAPAEVACDDLNFKPPTPKR